MELVPESPHDRTCYDAITVAGVDADEAPDMVVRWVLTCMSPHVDEIPTAHIHWNSEIDPVTKHPRKWEPKWVSVSLTPEARDALKGLQVVMAQKQNMLSYPSMSDAVVWAEEKLAKEKLVLRDPDMLTVKQVEHVKRVIEKELEDFRTGESVIKLLWNRIAELEQWREGQE